MFIVIDVLKSMWLWSNLQMKKLVSDTDGLPVDFKLSCAVNNSRSIFVYAQK